jgi:hypothetical protein
MIYWGWCLIFPPEDIMRTQTHHHRLLSTHYSYGMQYYRMIMMSNV